MMDTLPKSFSDPELNNFRQIGDPIADEAIALLVAEKGPSEARGLFDLLIRRIEMPIAELPECLQAYWASTDRLPDWVNWEQVKLANALFLDHGPKFLVFLYYKSLPLLYSCANGARVLVQTGRLNQQADGLDVFTRRIAETGQFLLTVMAPGALRPGGTGIQAIQKVRLIHAAIRFFTRHNGHWDEQAWGVPINQEDLAITLTTFSSAITNSLSQFNIQESAERLEAYQHTWAAIGQVLGIVPELQPKSVAESQALMEMILKRQAAASEEGRLLAKALLAFAQKIMPKEAQQIPALLVQHQIGPEYSQLLGIQPSRGCLGIVLPHFIGAFLRLGERLEDRIQGPLHLFIDLISQKMMEKMVQYFDTYKQRHFEVPAGLKRAWQQQ